MRQGIAKEGKISAHHGPACTLQICSPGSAPFYGGLSCQFGALAAGGGGPAPGSDPSAGLARGLSITDVGILSSAQGSVLGTCPMSGFPFTLLAGPNLGGIAMCPARLLPRILCSEWWPPVLPSQWVHIEKGTDSIGMFISSLSLITDLTLSSSYLPGRQSGCLEVQQPPFHLL